MQQKNSRLNHTESETKLKLSDYVQKNWLAFISLVVMYILVVTVFGDDRKEFETASSDSTNLEHIIEAPDVVTDINDEKINTSYLIDDNSRFFIEKDFSERAKIFYPRAFSIANINYACLQGRAVIFDAKGHASEEKIIESCMERRTAEAIDWKHVRYWNILPLSDKRFVSYHVTNYLRP